MFTIGITGGTGAGKTSALRAIASLGALVIDCDKVYHELLSRGEQMKSELSDRFPDVLKNGVIDRKRLGEIVFCDPSALMDLNAITHKYVIEEIQRQIDQWEKCGGTIAAIDAIALIESGIAEKCDIAVAVTAPVQDRISRIMARDGITWEQASRRINAQKPDRFFEENCDYLLKNVYNTAIEFEERCRAFFIEMTGGLTNA